MTRSRLRDAPRLGAGALILALAAASPLAAPSPARAQAPESVPAASETPVQPILLDGDSGLPVLAATRVTPGAETFTDPSTGVVFPKSLTVTAADGRTIALKAAGSGVRKKFVVKVYAAALWYDAAAPLASRPVDNLALDDIARRLVMSFRRDVGGDKIVEAYREGFEKVWTAKPGRDLATDLDEFLALFEGGVKEGETIELTYIPGEGLYTVVAGRAHPVVKNPGIARSLWSIWLGPEPVSGDLRRDLVRFLE